VRSYDWLHGACHVTWAAVPAAATNKMWVHKVTRFKDSIVMACLTGISVFKITCYTF
jgi:hypothetical protein